VLPDSQSELIDLADRIYRSTRDVTRLLLAVKGLQKAHKLKSDQFGVLWRLARLFTVLSQVERINGEKWSSLGRAAATTAIQVNGNGVEGHLYHSACTGILGRYRLSEAEDLSREALRSAITAAKLDPHYAGGFPRRIQGAIYLYAPAWPAGVGDLDEALDILEKLAREHPSPENYYYLAEAYRKTDQIKRAVRFYRRVMKFKARGVWRVEGPRFRAKVRQQLKQLAQ
jgi:tetratricopeptide (TPR) repeat protein